MRLNQAWLAGGAVLLAAGLLAQAPKTGVIFQCDEGNQARVTQCVNGRCDVELGPAGKLTPYMTLSVAGTNRFLRSQGCVDGGGKAAGAVVAAPKPAASAAGGSAPKAACKVDGPSAARPRGAANSTLAVTGGGYRYTYVEPHFEEYIDVASSGFVFETEVEIEPELQTHHVVFGASFRF